MSKSILIVGVVFVFCAVFFKNVRGHGLLVHPPNRSSLWRFLKGAPINYNDNQNFCGGFAVQWYVNGGKCGPCGDNYANPQPRDNENTGTYGRSIVTAQYLAGSVVNVTVLLTANHIGYFTYSICVLEDPNSPETEDCFVDVPLADGTYKYPVDPNVKNYVNEIQLPADLVCDRCVLRWHYYTGNSWGFCDDGTSGLGCGPQETFRTCSDIRIVGTEESNDTNVGIDYTVLNEVVHSIS